MYITRTIKKLIRSKPCLFTTPGHMQRFFQTDFSEIRGLDNLQQPSGVILASQCRAAEIYGSGEVFYLVNGSSSGIIALMLATVRHGEQVLIARNAHKSLINALILSGAEPVWVETLWNSEWDIPDAVNPQVIADKLEEYPDIKSVWITSPTYEGICSDISAIARICRQKNVLLVVDEAHGALWPFSERLPESAVQLGADACVQSLHKTGPCLTQGAILHLAKDSRICREQVQRSLNLINTTSPSYVLLSSIESSINYLESAKGRKKLAKLLLNIDLMKESLKKHANIAFLENADPTKVFLKLKGVSGYGLSGVLEENFNMEAELENDRGVLFLTGIGTDRKMLKKLTNALIKSDKILPKNYKYSIAKPLIVPQSVMTPAQAFFSQSGAGSTENAIGKVSNQIITRYPPGIPVLIPGELITKEHLAFTKEEPIT